MANKKTSPNDILRVKNILVGDNTQMSDVVQTTRTVRDEETGQPHTSYEETLIEWNTADYWQTRWGGAPFRIKPGETRLFLRNIAEKFAKELADFMLGRMEQQTGRRGLVTSSVERPKMLAAIILGVENYEHADSFETEGEKALAEVERLNRDEEAKAINVGVIPNQMVGILKPEPKSLDEIMKAAGTEDEPEGTMQDPPPLDVPPVTEPTTPPQGNGTPPPQTPKTTETTSIFDADKPKPTRNMMMKEAYRLGMELKGNETAAQLEGMLKKF